MGGASRGLLPAAAASAARFASVALMLAACSPSCMLYVGGRIQSDRMNGAALSGLRHKQSRFASVALMLAACGRGAPTGSAARRTSGALSQQRHKQNACQGPPSGLGAVLRGDTKHHRAAGSATIRWKSVASAQHRLSAHVWLHERKQLENLEAPRAGR